MSRKVKSEIICKCNEVRRDTVESAIRGGCRTVDDISDSTMAGIGACGGSCRRKLKPFLEHFLRTGSFPEKIVEETGEES